MINKYTAMDIANYIIWFSKKETTNGLSNLKLQKIIYFVYGKYLAVTNNKLFDEDIEKWQYGPVTPSVYHAFKDYGVYEINEPKDRFKINMSTGKPVLERERFDSSKLLSDNDFNQELINCEIKKHLHKDAYQLVEETHQHEIWSNFKDEIMSGKKGIKYSEDEIKSFFANEIN